MIVDHIAEFMLTWQLLKIVTLYQYHQTMISSLCGNILLPGVAGGSDQNCFVFCS